MPIIGDSATQQAWSWIEKNVDPFSIKTFASLAKTVDWLLIIKDDLSTPASEAVEQRMIELKEDFFYFGVQRLSGGLH